MTDKLSLDLESYLREKKAIIEQTLRGCLSNADPAVEIVFEAARYSLLAGGKRLRPVLCMAAWEALGGAETYEEVLPAACALEMIHTYSLVHDDLPAMDNDDLRRGVPTNHRIFGEGMAILAGDALLTESFALLSSPGAMQGIDPAKRLEVIAVIASAAGLNGMIAGQVIDLQAEGRQISLSDLQRLHLLKTGALIVASLQVGGILAGGDKKAIQALVDYGRRIGLAFQIVDDLLDVEGDRVLLGKNTGADARRGKVTFPSLMGCEESRKLTEKITAEAIAALSEFDDRAEPLRKIASFIATRKY